MSFRILGTGSYLPEKVVTNDDLSGFLDTSDEWISQRVGIHERHVSTHETAADMAAEAARNALENAGCTAQELDLILCATVSGETASPSVACMVQNRLGVSCMAFDINAACSAFLFLLDTAAGFFARGYRKILVIGAERMSRLVNWKDRSTCVIFGDGAGAAVLERDPENFYDSLFAVRGGDTVIRIPQSRGNSPFYEGACEEPYVFMNGQETFKFAVHSICRDIPEILTGNGLTVQDVRFIVPHQANKRIIDAAARKLGLSTEKIVMNIDRVGNTSSASIPIALDEINRAGRLKRGDLLLFSAFGGGLSSAAVLIRW